MNTEKVERILGTGRICGLCDATLETYADKCSVGLEVLCDGFREIERADGAREFPGGIYSVMPLMGGRGRIVRANPGDTTGYEEGW